ncbi:prasinophyte-specific protein 3 [mine drainage metagenome]|uniref:Prasinophyte-specific protein 3 n=1 Tax=mine drainage metagenome TaxID=410659 RepID=T1BAU1_9ZZZZ
MAESAAANGRISRQTESVLEIDVDREVAAVAAFGLEWAEKHETASLLEETKKTLLAQLIGEILAASRKDGKNGVSFAQAEMEALADVRYEAHLNEMTQARREANKARVRHETAGVRLEMLRSLMANRREEMRLAGMVR